MQPAKEGQCNLYSTPIYQSFQCLCCHKHNTKTLIYAEGEREHRVRPKQQGKFFESSSCKQIKLEIRVMHNHQTIFNSCNDPLCDSSPLNIAKILCSKHANPKYISSCIQSHPLSINIFQHNCIW